MQALLSTKDQATQNGLKTLDTILSAEIQKMRQNQTKKTDSDVGKVNLLNQLEGRSGGARSSVSRRSQTSEAIKKGMFTSKSTNIVKPTSPGLADL